MNIIEIKNLWKSYNNKDWVLKDISFNVKKGEIFGLLGPNGAGKSTTINILTTALNFQKGKIFVNGFDIETNKKKIRKIISVSSQNIALDYLLTVEDNLKIFAGLYGLNSKESSYLINKYLKDFNLLSKRNRKALELSGGQMRRLQVIRALLKKPEIIFLDEPTLGLDPVGKIEFLKYIKLFKEKNITVFLATNEMNEAEILCDRVCFINHGKIIDIQSVSEFISKHAKEVMIEISLKEKNDCFKLEKFIKNIDPEAIIYSKDPFSFSTKFSKTIIEQTISFLNKNNIVFNDIRNRKTTLNDAFIKIVNGEKND